MDIFAQIADRIIKEQEAIIGPIALEQAQKVPGITFDEVRHEVAISGDKKTTLENLVRQYEKLFGPASVEVCKEAVKTLVSKAPTNEVPSLLL
jgi:hypothetical protein